MSIQYRVAFGKKDEEVLGPDDATVVVTVEAASALLDPTQAFMLGKLKSTGPTGELFEALKDGSAAAALASLVQHRA